MSHRCVMLAEWKAYDHRLRELVCRTRDLELAKRHGVPRSTAKSWLRRGPPSVVTVELLDSDAERLRERVLRLERRTDDRTSCPRTRPMQLAPAEVRAMRDMVTSLDFRHFSVRALALHAQRVGRVIAAPGTWLRYIKANGWPRPRRRVHPPKPKDGVRTTRPNELWHLDTSVIKLLDGTRLFLHAVVDNFSRRLLAWELATKLDPTTTCRVLEAAGRHLQFGVPTVACDSGGENVNGQLDELIEAGTIKRILAQVEVAYSNSVVEAWFRSLKHSWLFLHTLDSAQAVEKLAALCEGPKIVQPSSLTTARRVRVRATQDLVPWTADRCRAIFWPWRPRAPTSS